jgi:hypothetical protein
LEEALCFDPAAQRENFRVVVTVLLLLASNNNDISHEFGP